MEDIYGNNDDVLQPGEDVNNNGSLDTDYLSGEAVRYNETESPALAATLDHRAFRRAVRLVNGTVLPGIYDAADSRKASETFVRFAMISGDARSSFEATPNQGGTDPRLTGGVHNFKRFLEDWGGVRLNYSGSLINLYNARNNNGAFKCCIKVYGAPTRNWVFDTSFLDPTRLPPGTPFFQNIQLTGFQRVN